MGLSQDALAQAVVLVYVQLNGSRRDKAAVVRR